MRRKFSSDEVREHRGGDRAGVVDQDVQCAAAEFGGRRGGFGRRRRVSHVEDERLRGAALGGNGFRGGHRGIFVDVGDQHRGPGRGEARAIASPTPLPAPVTSAERPSSRKTSRCWAISSSSAGRARAIPGS